MAFIDEVVLQHEVHSEVGNGAQHGEREREERKNREPQCSPWQL